MSLRYAQNHASNGQNLFQLAMVCGNNAVGTSVGPLRVSGQSTSAQNRMSYAVIHLDDNDLSPRTIVFTVPMKTPDGTTINNGDSCTVSMLDQRDWGACIDVKISFPTNQIVGGVVTPVALLALGTLVFFYRSPITNGVRRRSAATPNPNKWRNLNLIFASITTLIAIIATASHFWSVGPSFHVGPWWGCPVADTCHDTADSGLPAFHLVRLFSFLPVFIGLMCVAQPILVARGLQDPTKTARYQAIAFGIMATLSFTAFMIWICVLNAGLMPGWGLYMEIANCIFQIWCTIAAMVWYFHLNPSHPMSGKDTGATTGPPGGVDV